MDRDEVITRIRANDAELKRFGIRSLDLFGSAARSESTVESDLDFLVDFEPPVTYDRYIGLKMYLEDLLGCSIDLVTVAALKPRMRKSVERDAVRVA